MTRAAECVDHERVVLGAMMTSPAAVDEIAQLKITAEMFTPGAHQVVFRAILAARDAGQPAEPVALATRLISTGELAKVGGAPYLHTLMASVPTVANAGFYARQVREFNDWRQLHIAQARIGQLLDQPGGRSPADVADVARQMLEDLAVNPDAADPVAWADLIDPGLAEIEASGTPEGSARRIPTGFTDLDRLLGGGLTDGQLVVIAGRTSMGKSVAARGIPANVAFNLKMPAVLFSLEMTRQEVFECLLSAHTKVPLSLIQEGRLDDEDWTRIARWVGNHAEAPLYVDDTGTISLAEIRAKCRRLKARHGALGVVVVDYLQLMVNPRRVENRQQEVSELSRGLKLLAKELGCPVIAVSQLNRGPEQRADKTPQLADLRESGAIENDANVVILVYREDYYDRDSPRRGEADLILAKNRGGPKDTVTVAAQLHLARFVDMAVV